MDRGCRGVHNNVIMFVAGESLARACEHLVRRHTIHVLTSVTVIVDVDSTAVVGIMIALISHLIMNDDNSGNEFSRSNQLNRKAEVSFMYFLLFL